jgi:exonuclease VII small subunit
MTDTPEKEQLLDASIKLFTEGMKLLSTDRTPIE